jgi:hypothetical protein
MEVRNGSCGCGELKYSVEDEPINTVFCYCKECQIHTGSDKWFGAWFPKEKFKITEGIPSIYTRKGNSGKDMNHMFCPNCGVMVAAEVTVGNFYSVGVSTLHKVSGLTPSMAIYTSSAPSWAVYPEGVPKFDILPPGMGS